MRPMDKYIYSRYIFIYMRKSTVLYLTVSKQLSVVLININMRSYNQQEAGGGGGRGGAPSLMWNIFSIEGGFGALMCRRL